MSSSSETPTLYFITGNFDKYQEVKEFIPGLQQLDIDLTEIQELDPHVVIQAKLKEAFRHHEGPFIVEDTSLCLDALNGLPGTLIKWFLKAMGNDGLAHCAHVLNNVSAHARTDIGLALSSEKISFFEGRITGKIVSSRGEAGFGWDSIFQPEGSDKTFAEMSPTEKQSFSMRQIALKKLCAFLRK